MWGVASPPSREAAVHRVFLTLTLGRSDLFYDLSFLILAVKWGLDNQLIHF